MSLNIYSPSDVTVLLGGVIPVGGFSDGTFLEITKDIPPFVSKRATDGTTHRLYIKDSNYTIKFTLAQSSDTNDKLSRIQYLDETTQIAHFPILIKDSLGNSKFFSSVAFIDGVPAQTYSQGMEARTWTLKATEGISVLGGNDKTSDFEALVDTLLAASANYTNIIGDIF